nr:MAG TPA: hypothetical protein [Caudoviricetes sp.]
MHNSRNFDLETTRKPLQRKGLRAFLFRARDEWRVSSSVFSTNEFKGL